MVTKEMIKDSMEGCWRKHQIKLLSAALVGLLILVVLISPKGDFMKEIDLIIIMVIGFGLLILYQLIQYFMLFVDYKNYDVYEVTLERPTTSFWYRRTVYYTVYFKTNNGDFIKRDTKALWSDAVMSLFGVAEYGNATVKIAYNEDKDKLIVLGR